MSLTIEEQQQIITECRRMTTQLVEATNYRNTAEAKIKEYEDLIRFFSEQILLLTAKLDQLTGKQAPGTTFSA
jgi:hypothetical protein